LKIHHALKETSYLADKSSMVYFGGMATTIFSPPGAPRGDLAGLNESWGATSAMKQIKSSRRVRQQPLQEGQLWRMADGNLLVGMVGKLLVHYKLGKPDAVRVPISCNGIKTIEKYLKTKKAVLA
jgi:hypothetical protein